MSFIPGYLLKIEMISQKKKIVSNDTQIHCNHMCLQAKKKTTKQPKKAQAPFIFHHFFFLDNSFGVVCC
jgi:hypothetical protein